MKQKRSHCKVGNERDIYKGGIFRETSGGKLRDASTASNWRLALLLMRERV